MKEFLLHRKRKRLQRRNEQTNYEIFGVFFNVSYSQHVQFEKLIPINCRS